MASATYGNLLKAAQPRVIHDDKTYRRALKRVDELMKRRQLSPAEKMLLELLAKLVNDYEEEQYPTPDVSPAAMLRHLLDAKETTQAEVARQTGISRSTISEMQKGRRAASVENAFRLAEYFHVDATLFLARR